MDINTYLTDVNRRLEAAVSRKLGNVPVTLVGHRRNADGSDTPVFRVPRQCIEQATALGLTLVEHLVPPYEQRKRCRAATLAIGRTE